MRGREGGRQKGAGWGTANNDWLHLAVRHARWASLTFVSLAAFDTFA